MTSAPDGRERPHATASSPLPARSTSFVGRTGQLDALASALERTKILSVVGAGGVGKTSLALELCHRLELTDAFPDGICWVDLAPIARGNRVGEVVAAAAGLPEVAGREPEEVLAEWVRDRRLLLVLDNCEHVTRSCRELAGRLLTDSEGTRILATSRTLLDAPGETIWTVEPLRLPGPSTRPASASQLADSEAVQLFVERAGAVMPAFRLSDDNAASIEAVCRRLDGIPLAIELAAARVRVLTVTQIAERLDDALRLLSRGTDKVAHHQTMRASLEWSWGDLTEDQQVLQRRLAVFPGTFTLNAVECIAPDPTEGANNGLVPEDVLDLLADLVDRSFVHVLHPAGGSEVRYRLLDVVRQYCARHLVDEGEEVGTRDRHLAFYLLLAERAAPEILGPDQSLWLDALDSEHGNFLAALDWAAARPAISTQGVLLASALRWYWDRRGRLREGRKALEVAMNSAPGAPASVRADALNAAGTLAWRQADFDATQRYYEAALAARREAGDAHGAGLVMGNLGMLALALGNPTARQMLEESLATCRAHGDTRGAANALMNLGNVYLHELDFEAASESFTAARDAFSELGDRTMTTACMENVGIVAENLGDHELAAEIFEVVLAARRELDNPWGTANALHNLGVERLQLGEVDRARGLLLESLDVFAFLGDSYGIALGLEGAGHLALARGLAESAARHLGAAQALRESIHYVQPGDQAAVFEQGVTSARSSLGDDVFDRAFAAGHLATTEESISRARKDLNPPPSALTPSVAALTPREHEVAELIARGYTNAEIGAALCVVPKTVEKHVSNVLAKLGFAHRSQVAVWVATEASRTE